MMTHQANPWGPKQRLSVPLPGGQNAILSGALAAEKLKKQGMVVPRRGTRPQITTGPTNAPSSLRPLFTSFGRQHCPQIKAMGKVRCCTRVLPVNAIVLQFLEGTPVVSSHRGVDTPGNTFLLPLNSLMLIIVCRK